MSEVPTRFRKIAAAFTDRATGVSAASWDNDSPCEGWVARDIVRHMVAWMPDYFLGRRGIPLPSIPSVSSDPLAAWVSLADAIQSALDDPETRMLRPSDGSDEDWTLEDAVGAYGIGDVLIHTWDLARATGQGETLDAGEVHRLVGVLSRPDARVLENGHFAPSVPVAEGADEQTRLLALTGRRP